MHISDIEVIDRKPIAFIKIPRRVITGEFFVNKPNWDLLRFFVLSCLAFSMFKDEITITVDQLVNFFIWSRRKVHNIVKKFEFNPYFALMVENNTIHLDFRKYLQQEERWFVIYPGWFLKGIPYSFLEFKILVSVMNYAIIRKSVKQTICCSRRAANAKINPFAYKRKINDLTKKGWFKIVKESPGGIFRIELNPVLLNTVPMGSFFVFTSSKKVNDFSDNVVSFRKNKPKKQR